MFSTAAILAGGQSRRMGYDKYKIRINGQRLIDQMIETLRLEFPQIIVVANTDELELPSDVPCIRDEYTGCGPLAGIHAALRYAGSGYVYMIACDMPWVDLNYIRYLKKRIGDKAIDVCCFLDNDEYEPFHAFYSCRIGPVIEQQLLAGRPKLQELISRLDSLAVSRQDLITVGLNPQIFANLNTPGELENYQRHRRIPAISIMGWSGSGKTTFIEKLIPQLQARGLRIGVLKHDSHRFDMDREGKDTWRFSQAGAEVVAISSPDQAAVIEHRRLELDEMLARIRNVDLVIVEGYKASHLPRIEIHRLANGKPMCEKPENLAAVITDATLLTDTPVFEMDDAAGLAKFIAEKYLNL